MVGNARRRLVVVSYFHPPFPGAGGNRWEALSHYLCLLGYSVTVIACDAWGTLPSDSQLDVIRVADLRSISVLRRVLRRGRLQTVAGEQVTERPPTALLTQVVVPDLHAVSWVPAVVRRLRQLTSSGEVDCLLTSSPPDSAHLVGLLLGERRPPWIADFRDGWRFDDGRKPFPTSAQRRLDGWLERHVVQTADVAVGATAPITDDLSQRLGAALAATVRNGWDPRLSPSAASPVATSESPAVTLVHTGNLSGAGRDPAPLLQALRATRSATGDATVRLLHAGRMTTDERALIDDLGVGDIVQHVGNLPRPDALALQRSADALILITSRNPSEATSKIFEYLAAGRPILALADGNEAARIVCETNTGLTVPPDNVAAIEVALRRVGSGELASAYAPHDVERFTYPGPAEAIADLVESAIERKNSGGS